MSMETLDESTRTELATWMDAEVAKARVRSQIHGFTDMCFKKCVSSISSPKLSTSESTCVQNCIGRFLDTNVEIVKIVSDPSNIP